MLHDATKSAGPLGALGTGVYTNILNAIEKAEMAANQSTVAADQALKVTSVIFVIHRGNQNFYNLCLILSR